MQGRRMPHPAQRIKKSPLNGGPIPLTAGSVEAVKIAQGPFTVTFAGADHWNVTFGIERSNAAELQRQSIQPAKRGAAEPATV